MATAASMVWGAAVAAQRINGEYLKEDVWNHNSPAAFISKTANKRIVRNAVETNDFSFVTAADIADGEQVRNHFKGYLFLQIAGRCNDFQATALKIAQLEEFTTKHALELSVCASLPSVAQRDNIRKDMESRIRNSTSIPGSEGDKVTGTIIVEATRYNADFNKFMIQARMGENSYVDFWYKENLPIGAVKNIKGKIKQQRGNNATQLNYVKIL